MGEKKLRNIAKIIYEYRIYMLLLLGCLIFSKYQYGLRDLNPIYTEGISKTIVTWSSIGVCICTGVIFESKHLNFMKKFICVYALLSVLYLLALPMYREADGIAHFARAYEISEGHLLSDKNELGIGGRELPRGLFLDMDDDLKKIPSGFEKRLGDERVFMNFWGASLYNPITYLPQAIAIGAVRLFTDRVLVMAYAARIINWLCSFLLIGVSIRYIPGTRNKKLMALIALFP